MSRGTRIVFFLLFLIIVFVPLLVGDDWYGIPEEMLESIAIALTLLVTFVLFKYVQQDIRCKEQAKAEAERKYYYSLNKLNDAFRHVGIVNRQISMVEEITSQVVEKLNGEKSKNKEAIMQLLRIAAVSLAQTPWAVFRLLDTETKKTLGEYHFSQDVESRQPSISNKLLVLQDCQSISILPHRSFISIKANSEQNRLKGFLILPTLTKDNTFLSWLRIVTDQLFLVSHLLYLQF